MNQNIKGLGGAMFVHNAIEFDYCVEQAILSLIGICERVVIADCQSTDGTKALLDSLAEKHPTLRVITLPWNPVPAPHDQSLQGKWLRDIANTVRIKLKTPMQFQLQADEVIHERCYPEIRELAESRKKAFVKRWNFWRDPHHIISPSIWCGSTVCRIASTKAVVEGDAESIDPKHAVKSTVEIFHYGALRKAEALVAKSIPMQEAYWQTHDPILDEMKTGGAKVLHDRYADNLIPFTGTHPAVMKDWLTARGYTV